MVAWCRAFTVGRWLIDRNRQSEEEGIDLVGSEGGGRQPIRSGSILEEGNDSDSDWQKLGKQSWQTGS